MNDDHSSIEQDSYKTNTMKTTTSSLPTLTTIESQPQDYPADLLCSLRQHSLFQRTNNEEFLNRLASGMHLRIYNPRDIIITKGETSKAMFFLLRGQVDVCSADFERTYATLSQGACFGEIGILYARPRTATVVASLKCTVAALTSEQVHMLLPQFPDVEKIIRFEAEERLAMMDKMEKNGRLDMRETEQREQQARSPIAEQEQSPKSNETTLTVPLPETCDRSRRSSIQYNVESFGKTGIRNYLDKIPFFYGCSEDFLHMICLSIQPRCYDPNTTIFDQDDLGDEMYFIVDGSVDVESETNPEIYGRLGPGGYFGDVSVLLDFPRAATVKTVEQVELYVLNRTNFQQVCDLFPDAAARLKKQTGDRLDDFNHGKLDEISGIRPTPLKEDRPSQSSKCRTTCDQDPTSPMTPASQLRKAETRKRRASIAVWNDPILADMSQKAAINKQQQQQQQPPQIDVAKLNEYQQDDMDNDKNDNYSLEQSNRRNLELPPSPSWTIQLGLPLLSPPQKQDNDGFNLNAPTMTQTTDRLTTMSSSILIRIMDYLDFGTIIQMMRLNRSIQTIFALEKSLNHIDLSTIHKKITDDTLTHLMSLIRQRLRSLSLSQCFHLTDSGFRSLLTDDTNTKDYSDTPIPPSLSSATLHHLHTLDLNSCWLLTDHSLHLLGEKCPQLSHLDLSNCRKITNAGMYRFLEAKQQHLSVDSSTTTNTARGLEWLSLSYCKNLTDVTMQHLVDFTRNTLTYLNLQRCTKITDQGFIAWANTTTATSTTFIRLRELILADCSFLTDRAIQCLTKVAPGLERLSLSFCCSLSDSAMYHLAHLDHLVDVDVSFCGAAVSDISLKLLVGHGSRRSSVSGTLSLLSSPENTPPLWNHLQQYTSTNGNTLPIITGDITRTLQILPLKRLNIRGCVRVTGNGLLSFLYTSPVNLSELNISQCPSIPIETQQRIMDLSLVQHLII